jgi:hypothetical protein
MHCPWKRDGPLRAQMMRLDVSVGYVWLNWRRNLDVADGAMLDVKP